MTARARKAAVRWAVGYAGHVLAFHLLRLPLYGLRSAGALMGCLRRRLEMVTNEAD